MTSSARLLIQQGKRYLTLSLLALGIGFCVGALAADRPDWSTFLWLGLVFLGFSYPAYRSFRSGTMVESDCFRVLRDEGFDVSAKPIRRGNVSAKLHFQGRKWSLLMLRTNWASTRLLDFEFSCQLPDAMATIRQSSGTLVPLPIRTERKGSIGGITMAANKRFHLEAQAVGYLDINLEIADNHVTIGVFGNVFNRPELRSNVHNALAMVDSLQQKGVS